MVVRKKLQSYRRVISESISEQVLKRYLVARLVFAKRNLKNLLDSGVTALKSGDVENTIKTLDEFWSFLNVREEEAEIGYRLVLQTEWLYALGPRDKNKVIEIVKEVKDIRRSLRSYLNQGPVSDRLIKRLEALAQDASWLDRKAPFKESEFSHGDFTIVPMPGVPKIKECLEALDKASELIRRKFPQLLYGKIYINRTVSGGVANYVAAQDSIQLSLNATKTVGDVYALCHEFGHRYEHKFWKDRGQRDVFWHLSTDTVYETIILDKTTREKLADEFLEIANAQLQNKKRVQSDLLRQFLEDRIKKDLNTMREASQAYLANPDKRNELTLRKFIALPQVDRYSIVTDKIVHGPIHVTPYAAKKGWKENFAEAFAYYILGKALPLEITAIMEKLQHA
jgi:hypothetical protein